MRSHRVITSLVVALAALVLSSTPALAGREWCARDPILQFADGSRVQWVVQFDPVDLPTLTGPVTFSYVVPSNVGPIVVGFPSSASPETVRIAYTGKTWSGKGAIPVNVRVTLAATATFKTVTSVRGNVVRSLDINGTSNTEVKASAMVDPAQWSDLLGVDAVIARFLVTATTTVTGP